MKVAESLYQQTESKGRDGNEACKLMLTNKRLSERNAALEKELAKTQQALHEAGEKHSNMIEKYALS